MMTTCKCIAKIQSELKEKEYEKAKLATALISNQMTPENWPWSGPIAWEKPHPLFAERLAQYEKTIVKTRNEKHDMASFGDSLMDGWTKKEFTSVAECRNFNVGGEWAHHTQAMFEAVIPILLRNRVRVDYITIGSMGGNPFLNLQPLEITVQKSIECLNALRKMLPFTKFIVYGIPPTVIKYVNDVAPEYEVLIYQWVLEDVNSVYLPLNKKFTTYKLLPVPHYRPKAFMSADGVHFSELGIYDFDRVLLKAKKARAKSIVD